VRDERRYDDDSDPLWDDVTKQQSQRRYEDEQDGELADLDADIEREQRGEEVVAGELQSCRAG
jgi:hypothetical protein